MGISLSGTSQLFAKAKTHSGETMRGKGEFFFYKSLDEGLVYAGEYQWRLQNKYYTSTKAILKHML